eukprot:4348753-Pyramimonas_sp.AAC.1
MQKEQAGEHTNKHDSPPLPSPPGGGRGDLEGRAAGPRSPRGALPRGRRGGQGDRPLRRCCALAALG